MTNGMSYADRAGENANAALLVTLNPEEFPGTDPLSGMQWQEEIEKRAFTLGGGNYFAPAQLVGDFLKGKPSTGPGMVQPTYRPGVTWCDLHQVLPEKITHALAEALPRLEGKLRGFFPPGGGSHRPGNPQLLPGADCPEPGTTVHRPFGPLPGRRRRRLRRRHHVRRH